jgi:Xaa-Pro dipeptidase
MEGSMSSDPVRTPAFPRDEFDQRVRRVREGLQARGLDAGIFAAAESVYYLTGYESPSHFGFQLLVLPVDQEPFVVIRQHMASGVRAESWVEDVPTFPDTGDPIAATRQALADRKLAGRRLAFEETAPPLTLQTARRLEAALGSGPLADCSGIVEALRVVKSPREIEYMRQAAKVSDVGMEAARGMIRVGVSELEIYAEVTRQTTLAGGEYQASPLPIGIQERTRLAIPLATSRRLGPGEVLWMECFGTVRRYSAGLKAIFGAKPATEDTLRRAEVARRALKQAVAAIAPGRPASIVPETVQEVFREAGYSEGAYHQSGYSIGIAFAPNPHEARILSLRRGNTTPLQVGMTLFPIANLYGPGPISSASAMIVVTPTGAETLNRFVPLPDDLER